MVIFLYFQSRDLMPWQQHNSHSEVAGSLLSLTTSIRSCGLTIHIKGRWTHAQEYCRHFEFQVPCFKGNERRSLKNEYSYSMTCKSVAGYSAVKLFLSVILLLPSQAHARESHITESVHRTNSDTTVCPRFLTHSTAENVVTPLEHNVAESRIEIYLLHQTILSTL